MATSVPTLWTVGHSTRSIDEFVDILRAAEIETLVDVRHFPGSRRYPHFNREALRDALAAAGIGYEHLPELGGRRKPRPDSPNLAWRHEAFRGYADYMETSAFRDGLARLVAIVGAGRRVAIMCSEAVWWRCHRSLIADALKAQGWQVWHLMGSGKVQEHPYTSAASIIAGQLSYRGVL